MKTWALLFLLIPVLSGAGATATTNFLEPGKLEWRFWTREKDAGKLEIDDAVYHGGAHIEHGGSKDWSLEPQGRIKVQPGDFVEMEAWVRAEGEGAASLCASTWNEAGQAVEWSYGDRPATMGAGWQHLRTRLLAAPGIAEIQPRVIGAGAVNVWVDRFSVRKLPGLAQRTNSNRPALSVSNRFLLVTLSSSNAAYSIKDLRTGRTWKQRPVSHDMLMTSAAASSNEIRMELLHVTSGLDVTNTLSLAPSEPELTMELSATGELLTAMRFPNPIETAPGDYLVIPMNEGISYPVEDASVPLHRLVAYGGHGICMAFWGVTDGGAGHMCIIETPDDAAVQLQRLDGKLAVAAEWDPQKKQFGYMRKLRYVFFETGGHVAMAKRYRAYAQQAGFFKTLAEKRKKVPAIDSLVGAVNVWCWDKDAPAIVREMRAAGIERILWSNQQSPEKLRVLNDLGVLTSRYDIYQDVMNPTEFPKLRWVHPDWTTAAWPKDIILGPNGKFIKGWGVEAKDGSMVSCGVICDRQALQYARERVPADLSEHPYKCRFIDTTTAAPWHECYSPEHPMSRSESRRYKMELLGYMSGEMKLVTGCETGHDASVPFVDYFEGMLSLGPYRVPDAGRRMQVIWTNVPEAVAKFQLGHNYRLPLWELVFHDCVVAQWYWGDYNNKLPALWDKRDLFNVLYGTPPMFMFDRALWTQQKERFARSYRTVCPLVRDVGYSEMTDHKFLTADRSVQQTSFASGHRVTVNFGDREFSMRDGRKLEPAGLLIEKSP